MPPRRTPLAARTAAAGALLAALTHGCASLPITPAGATTACAPEHLDGCESKLAAAIAVEGAPRELIVAYTSARAARDASDPWATIERALGVPDRGARPKAIVIIDGTGVVPSMSSMASMRSIRVASLPPAGAIDADDLLLAMASAAGYEHVVRVRGGTATHFFPSDPLAPFMPGIRPVLSGDAKDVEADVAADEALRSAFEAAAALHYVDAVRAAEKLSASIAARDAYAEPVLRARYALQLLGAAGLVLDAEENAPPKSPLPPEPSPQAETPYASFLRVVTAKDARQAWDTFGPRVLAGATAARRDDIEALFARSHACEAPRIPSMDGPRDLVFANRLAAALPRDLAEPAAGEPLGEWLARYEAMVGLVERTHTAWSYLPAMLSPRGLLPSVSAAATPLHQRVRALGLAHLAASKEVEEAFPTRYPAFAPIGLALTPGVLGDEKLRDALVQLTEASVRDRLAAAKGASSLLLGVATGAAGGLSYPPALQEAHFVALAGAASSRLKGDFLQKQGWAVAALYALDAVYRLAADQGGDLAFSSAQIARSLGAERPGESRDIEYPALASLAAAAARYAALAAQHRLDPGIAAERFPLERRAAREGLRAALAGLGAPGEAPNNVLDDVTELADGLVATLSTAIAKAAATKAKTAPRAHPPSRAKARAPEPAMCAPSSTVQLDPALRRALARLGDVRRRVLSHPRYTRGDGLWVRRVRLVVTVLSDAMDLAIASDTQKAPAFTVPQADVRRAVEEALRELDQKAIADVVAGGYGLFRELSTSGDPDKLIKAGSKDLRRVAGGLVALFRGDALGGKGPAMGVALLDALAAMRFEAPPPDDLSAALASYANAFYDEKKIDQGDLCLLAILVGSTVTHARVPASVLDRAAHEGSRVAWLLRFTQEVHREGTNEAPDPAKYADDLRKATDDACQAPDAEATLAVMRAIHDRAAGKKREAREALDRVLDDAETRGLGVPRMIYRYDEKTATKVFTATVDVSYGSGLLARGSSFQLGLGLRSAGEPGGAMTSTLASLDSAKASEDAARYYVYTAALAAAYHFRDGDAERAIASARRAIAALSSGLKLGSRALLSDQPAAWGTDARDLLVIDAQLAAEAGMPFLAGDLWTVVRQGLSERLDDKEVAAVLAHLPVGLAGEADVAPVVERAKRSFKILAARLPCTAAKVELGGFEEVSCEAYPLALSLRIADVLKKLPRMRHGETGAHCGPLRSLDAFLAGAERAAYDPDAFTKAVDELRADGKTYDAATLIARHKHPSHCSPPIVAAARTLGRSPILGPWIRADLRSAAVNCTALAGGPEVRDDILAIDEDTRALPDPSRNLRLLLSAADLASRTNRWDTLDALVQKPDFVGRWMAIHPNAAAAALLLDHAVAAIEGRAPSLDRTKESHDLLCETLRAPERADLCAMIDALRAPLTGPPPERQRMAREAVKKLVATSTSPPPTKTP